MDVKDYCDNVVVELSGWQSKIADIVRKLDHIPTGDKERVVSEVNEIHMILDQINDRIEGLKSQCSTTWRPQTEPEHEIAWPEQSGETFEGVSQSDVGG